MTGYGSVVTSSDPRTNLTSDPTNPPPQRYESFQTFYPFYLRQHAKAGTRRMHFLGTTLAMMVLGVAGWTYFWLALVVGYGHAWISHAWIERNKPATFQYPLYSFLGDLKLWSEMIQGKRWTDNPTDQVDQDKDAPETIHLVV